jgi:hypothetical protein
MRFDLLKRPSLIGRLTGSDLRSRLRKAVETAHARLVWSSEDTSWSPPPSRCSGAIPGFPWVNWFPDDLRTVDEVVRLAPAYDMVFASGSDVATRLEVALRRPVEVVPPAADPSVYRPLRSKDQYRANVVFAGLRHRPPGNLLTGLVEYGLALWGPGWRHTSLKDYCRGEVPSTEDYVRAYGGASVAVNIHHTAGGNGDGEACVNERSVRGGGDRRAPGGGLSRRPGRHFKPGRDTHGVPRRRWAPDDRRGGAPGSSGGRADGVSARREVLTRHTYMHRLKIILDAVVAGR